jgi:hypothetical protein
LRPPRPRVPWGESGHPRLISRAAVSRGRHGAHLSGRQSFHKRWTTPRGPAFGNGRWTAKTESFDLRWGMNEVDCDSAPAVKGPSPAASERRRPHISISHRQWSTPRGANAPGDLSPLSVCPPSSRCMARNNSPTKEGRAVDRPPLLQSDLPFRLGYKSPLMFTN